LHRAPRPNKFSKARPHTFRREPSRPVQVLANGHHELQPAVSNFTDFKCASSSAHQLQLQLVELMNSELILTIIAIDDFKIGLDLRTVRSRVVKQRWQLQTDLELCGTVLRVIQCNSMESD